MKVHIIAYEDTDDSGEFKEKIYEELNLIPEKLDANSVVFNYKNQSIRFSVGIGDVRGYIHPLADGKFLYLSEEEWTTILLK